MTEMRIDFVITELFVGGAEKCLTELALAMAAGGDHVRVFSIGGFPEGEQGTLVGRLRQAEIPVESLEAEAVWKYPQAFRNLRDYFWDSPPDVVQTFLHHANVLGMHAATAAGIETRVAGVRVAQPRWFRCQVERRALRRAHSVVCVSQAVQRFAISRLGCRQDSTIVIPNGIDVGRFTSAKPMQWSRLGWPNDSQVCLFLGRLDHQKGIELLQKQIDRIAPSQSNRKLLLVGDGDLRSQLEAWCDEIGPQRVQLLPWQAEVAPIIQASRMLVLPSHYEGMPNVVLEAMAAAKPVVCSLVEGSEELLSHAPQLQGFAPGDSSQMANLIEGFASDETRCIDVGMLNQQRVKQQFSLHAMIETYREHYRTLLTGRLGDS